MDITDISALVNSATEQAMGTTALTVIDDTGVIALGNTVLSSSDNTENWTGALFRMIGMQIISHRRYEPSLMRMLRNDFEWGAIVQKIDIGMPQVEKDESYDINDGDSVDMYKVNKLKVRQSLFTTETPYQIHISVKRQDLKEAFTSMNKMGAFITAQFGEVQNAINLALERLNMNTVNNYIAEVNENAKREIKLVTEFNDKYGETLTVDTALESDAFLRYAIRRIKIISDRMVRMTKGVFNDGKKERHTPYSMQNLYVASDFERALETVSLYQAFHDNYLKLQGYETIPFWQSIETPLDVNLKRASDSAETTVSGVIATLFDYEALGTYKADEWAANTPLNAAGGYINYYWHMKDMYFNDLSENFVTFILA